jgi:hypothetical protein
MSKIGVLMAAICALCALSSAQARKTQDGLLSCMWGKMPTTTDAFINNTDIPKDFELFVLASAACDTTKGSMTLNLKSVKKKLLKIRPTVIGPDTVKPTNVFVCDKATDGKLQPCRDPAT